MASNNVHINIPVLFLLSFIMPLAAISNESTPNESMIQLGSLLSVRGNTSSSSWVSSSGHFAFGFYPQGDDKYYNGYAIGIWLVGGATKSENTLVWTARRDDPPVSAGATLQLTQNSLLLVKGEDRRGLFTISDLVASASMLNNGNFVIYGKEKGDMKNVLWQSFDYPTDTILGGQSISYKGQEPILGTNNGNKLVSSLSKVDHSSGSFTIVIDFYGLVAFPMNSFTLFKYAPTTFQQSRHVLPEDAYWSNYSVLQPAAGPPRYVSPPPPSFSKSSNEKNRESLQYRGALGPGYVRLSLSHEGSLCITESQCMTNYTNMKKKPQGNNNVTSIFRATLDVDGNFRLYEHQFEAYKGNNTNSSVVIVKTLWEALSDECQIKGFCGLNSYCSNVSGKATCACYPGFVPSSQNSYNNNMFLDCKLSYSIDDCVISDDPIMLYDVTNLENMWWGQFPYLVVQTTKEACEESCKEDCDCGGALYANNNGSCYKYQVPLKYGRRIPNSPFMAILKVPSLGHVNSNSSSMMPPMMKKPKVFVFVVEDKRSLIMTLGFTFGSISLICVVFAMFIFFTYKHQVYRYTKLSTSSNVGFIEECSLRSFSFDELEKATAGFTEEIGRGSFGAVYRGTILENNRRIEIAVKRLEKFVDEGEREFRAEITAIARTHHRNLVKLIGFCVDGCKKLLVYDYVSNGSLSNLLFKAKKNKYLPWEQRLRIALDVARGVQYLHEECEFRIIHCNIKPQNILMDEAWTAKISDFGFARLLKHENSGDVDDDGGITAISRYLAPEWQNDASSSSESVKADIFSYGVVLLEIACRRRGIEVNVSSPDEVLLSTWVHQCFAAGQLNKLVESYDEEEEEVEGEEDVDLMMIIMERMVKVGLWCVQDDPSMRPSIKNVILMLEGWKEIPIPPSPPHRV